MVNTAHTLPLLSPVAQNVQEPHVTANRSQSKDRLRICVSRPRRRTFWNKFRIRLPRCRLRNKFQGCLRGDPIYFCATMFGMLYPFFQCIVVYVYVYSTYGPRWGPCFILFPALVRCILEWLNRPRMSMVFRWLWFHALYMQALLAIFRYEWARFMEEIAAQSGNTTRQLEAIPKVY